MVFWPACDFPRAATASTALAKAAARAARSGSAGNSLPSVMNSVPNSGPEAPPTVITSLVPIAFSASGSGFAAIAVGVGAHRLEAALHVEPMVAVADRLVERGQFVGMRGDRVGDRRDRALRCRSRPWLSPPSSSQALAAAAAFFQPFLMCL